MLAETSSPQASPRPDAPGDGGPHTRLPCRVCLPVRDRRRRGPRSRRSLLCPCRPGGATSYRIRVPLSLLGDFHRPPGVKCKMNNQTIPSGLGPLDPRHHAWTSQILASGCLQSCHRAMIGSSRAGSEPPSRATGFELSIARWSGCSGQCRLFPYLEGSRRSPPAGW